MTTPIANKLAAARKLIEPPKDGTVFYAVVRVPMRWKAYKPNSFQRAKVGLRGRWQEANGYGGWNATQIDPTQWELLPAPAEQLARDGAE